MDNHSDETSHTILLGKFENNKKYKERIVREIAVAICAMLNTNGGKVVIHFETDGSDIPGEGSPFSKLSLVIRILEQFMNSIIGENQTVSNINFRHTEDCIIIFIKKAGSIITMNYNLYYLPSHTQAVEGSRLKPPEHVKSDIMYRKVIPYPVELGSHCRTFHKEKNCGFRESKTCQLKNVKAGASKRTTLADGMTGKGNKFRCYVSAFANHSGGHIYYGITGITDDSVVKGELIPNEEDKGEIIKNVENAINKMIWPEQIGQPKRGEHWEIFFEPVVDENSKPVPSTFVIVIYIAPCLGGVFTEVPECYEMVEGKVMKMSFVTWKKRISLPVFSQGKDEIPPDVSRATWSSKAVRKAFTLRYEILGQLINNGDWEAFSKTCRRLQEQSEVPELKLVGLSKRITACYVKGNFHDASELLRIYKEQLLLVLTFQETLIFEVIYLTLKAALKRARRDFNGLAELLSDALKIAELIEPGLVTATVYIFAASVTDLIRFEFSPEVLSIRALEHLQCVRDFPSVVADKQQRSHIILASGYLGCNLSGQPTKVSVNTLDICQAKTSIMAVHGSILEGNPLSKYHEVQFKLVKSIYDYRHSQVSPDKRVSLLRNAFNYANEAECLARQYQFREMVEWSKTNKALCTEELVKEKLLELKLGFTIAQGLYVHTKNELQTSFDMNETSVQDTTSFDVTNALEFRELVRIHAPFNTNGGGTLELVSTEREGDTYQESPVSWKWEERSIVHRQKFIDLREYAKAHPEEIEEVNGVRVCCSKEFLIGKGTDGTRVYVGLGEDGVERAVKRLLRDSCCSSAEQEKKVLNELNTASSKFVVNYWFFEEQNDKHYLFLILDLCEETLEDFVKRSCEEDLVKHAPAIIRQVLKGLIDLHRDPNPILHRDLKPSNILRGIQGNWLLADFGISRILTEDVTTHESSKSRGTEDWKAVESCSFGVITDDDESGKVRYKKESDIQVAGIVAFYILTKGEHPFGEKADRLRNLLDGKPVGLDTLKDDAAKDFIAWMLSHDPKDRPSAKEALRHPYHQFEKKKFEMLCKVGNQPEIKKEDVKSDVVRMLNSDPNDWRNEMEPDVLKYLSTDCLSGKTFRYKPSWTNCLRLIRNVKEHWEDRPRPRAEIFYIVGNPQEFFLNLFPSLPVEVHRIIRSCDWKERPDLKEYFI